MSNMASVMPLPVRETLGVRRHPEVPEEHRIPDDKLERIFRRMDSLDGSFDGRIESSRLVEVLNMLHQRRSSEEYKQVMEEILLADIDNDGKLDRKEFYRLMCNIRRKVEISPESTDGGGDQNSVENYLNDVADAEKYRWCPPPWFITLMTVAQISFFIFHIFHFMGKEGGGIPTTWTGPYQFCSMAVFNPRRRRELWRFITYIVVHAGWQHLLINVFLQLLVGLPLEMSNGSLRVGTVYMSGALFGSLGVSAILPRKYLVGASASVFALVGGHCASMILNWKEDRVVIRDRFRRHFRRQMQYTLAGAAAAASEAATRQEALKQTRKVKNLRIVRLAFVILLVGVDVGMTFSAECRNGLSGCTTLEAHLCGLCAGLLVGTVVLRNRREEPWELKARVIAGVVFVATVATAITWELLGDTVWMASEGRDWFLAEDYGSLSVNCSYHHRFP